MDGIEQRVAYVEGRLAEHGQVVNDIRGCIGRLEERMDRRFDGVDRRFDRLEDRMNRLFMWQVGIQITTLTAVVVALFSR
jgi:hypothetical protein